MGLKWLRAIQERRSDSQEGKLPEVTASRIERVLLVGFGKISGFHCFDWEDWEWPNAADFEAVFINCGTLYTLLHDWKNKHSEGETGLSPKPFDRLRTNLDRLEEQVLQIINSGRCVFGLATPEHTFQYEGDTFYPRSIYSYSWCPLPVDTHQEKGEVSRDIDPRFSEYRKQLKEWRFYFDMKPKILEHMDRSELSRNQEYVLLVRGLFENLSLQPLGVELQYGVYDSVKQSLLGDVVSGSIYLVHYPIGGDPRESIRCLLREFCDIDLVESDEPEWVHSVILPRGAELDEQIGLLSEQIEALADKRERLVQERKELGHWRKLLYETGAILEDVVVEALKLLGLKDAQLGPKGDHDIAGVFEGEMLVFEVKGLNGSAGRKEVFDLNRHIDEFELKNPEKKVSKGILVANAYRHDPPNTRENDGKQVFSGDAVDHAKLLNFALLDTRVLYELVVDVIEGEVSETDEVLGDLRGTVGIYSR